MAIAPPRAVGGLLRDWRQRRRLSQLDLAVEAEVSARHLSFVETGRSRPSRELVLHLAEHLDVPLRERNSLLLAAGYAPVYHHTPLGAAEMAPVSDALDKIIGGHEPFPAVVVDRRWDVVAANRPAQTILTDGVTPSLLARPMNALRVSLHPEGLAPRIVNLSEWSSHLLGRLRREIVASADPNLVALADELRGYPGVRDEAAHAPDPATLLFVPLMLRVSDQQQLRFFSTIATFGTALDITMAELSIESFFPADDATAATLRAHAS
ncbi:MAG: helix-turn-helix domain-containing protein [Acidimicrobiales bacterium]